MSPIEARYLIHKATDGDYVDGEELIEALTIMDKAMGKLTPVDAEYGVSSSRDVIYCPICGHEQSQKYKKRLKFCYNCGQLLIFKE